MRLWAWQIIPYLPRKQLVSQWRECCCIAKNMEINKSPNHILVNKIIDYPDEDFDCYTLLVYGEMLRRGYKCDFSKFERYRKIKPIEITMETKDCFKYWHNKRYVRQCIANLSEKYDNGGFSTTEWVELINGYKKLYNEEYVL